MSYALSTAYASNAHQRKKALVDATASMTDEIEIKLLVKNDDPSVFKEIEGFFAREEMIRLTSLNRRLQTRQFDTRTMDLLKQGRTLRIRGECVENDLNIIHHPDICLKDEKRTMQSGAVQRNEYEAPIESFSGNGTAPLFKSFFKKYPKATHPELHRTLQAIPEHTLVEHFRIDCIRNRYVVELPREVTGIAGKKVYAELIMDDVAFVIDLPNRRKPLVFHRDLEVEVEILKKACSYDDRPKAAAQYVSSSTLTLDEMNKALLAIKALMKDVSSNQLTDNNDSKAERGFRELDTLLKGLQDRLVVNDPNTHSFLPSAFAAAANADQLIPEGMEDVMASRPIARRKNNNSKCVRQPS